MTEYHIPTGQELDALLSEEPQFDLDAVKRRTLSRIGVPAEQPRKRQLPLRGLLIAAVVCALSAGVVAAADHATNGQIIQALGIRKPEVEAVAPSAPEKAPVPEEKASPAQPTKPKPAPEEPPELDAQVAEALSIPKEQARQLRPAVQKVGQTAEDQGVRMTVLQTLGDPACLYIKLRFDFPETVTASGYLEFDSLNISLEGADGYGWSETILEQDDHSITYLLSTHFYGGDSLNGRTITVTAENYGHPHQYTADEVVQLAGEAGKPYTSILYPGGAIDWEVTEEDLAALPPEAEPTVIYSEGFTISVRTDGSKVVTYDGERGDQTLTVYLAPNFDTVVAGKWEQSWTLQYQDLSLYWKGETELFDPRLTLTELRLSPLSWEARFTAREPQGEELGFGLLYGKEWNVRLRRRDGSLTDLPQHFNAGLSEDGTPDGMYTVSTFSTGTVFDQPIDLMDVTAIVIGGMEFPLS